MDRERTGFVARTRDAVRVAVVIPVVGILAACIGMAAFFCGDLVWTDLLHANPNRSFGNVMEMLLPSPIYGLFMGLMLLGLPIVAGGLLAGLTTVVWGRPSLRGMAVLSAISTVLFVRWCYAAAEVVAETPDWRRDAPPWATLIGGSALLTVSLHAGWQVQRWMSARSMPTVG